jgi:hypothetical protein
MERANKGVRPPESVQAAVRELIEQRGEAAATSQLGIASATVSRLLSGQRVQRGTVAMVRMALGMTDAS